MGVLSLFISEDQKVKREVSAAVCLYPSLDSSSLGNLDHLMWVGLRFETRNRGRGTQVFGRGLRWSSTRRQWLHISVPGTKPAIGTTWLPCPNHHNLYIGSVRYCLLGDYRLGQVKYSLRLRDAYCEFTWVVEHINQYCPKYSHRFLNNFKGI